MPLSSTIAGRPASVGVKEPSAAARSAPVLEFVCLFTHDLRRKQKRWEDGRLKYHTFNKRVMVYDERGNFVGDMHWQRDWEFDEGEEVQLERGGVIVQVVECVGRQEQDLSELLDKRVKEKEQRQTRAAVRPSPAGTRVSDHFQTRHRPLNQVLGTPTGHHGRAVVPTESPFELRQKASETTDNRTDSRAVKRRKCDTTPPSKLGYAQSLFGATLSLSAVPMVSASHRRPTGPAYRGQPETSPQEESMPDVEAVGGNRVVCDGVGLQADSSGTRTVVTPSRTTLETARRVKLGNGKSTKPAAKPVASERPKAALPVPQVGIQRVTGTSDGRPRSSSNNQSQAGAVGQVIASRGSEKKTGTRTTNDIEAIRVRVEENPCVTDNLDLSTSLSQAIVLDDGLNRKPSGAPDNTANSRHIAPTAVGQRPPRLHDLLSVATKSMETRKAMDDQCNDERTELRLKPRQKRGLLLLSEKRTKTDHSNRRIPLAEEESPPPVSPWAPTNAIAPEFDLPSGAEPANNATAVHENDLFASSSYAPGKLTGLGPTIDDAEIKTDSILDLGASHRRKRVRQRGKDSAQADQKSGEPASPHMRRGLRSLAEEASKSKPARQARNTKKPDDQGSNLPSRKVPEAGLEDSGNEEQPEARVGPRLARLGRKSVKSREVIGFVPSSPPVPNPVNPMRPLSSVSGSQIAADTVAAICVSESGGKGSPVPEKKRPLVENPQNSLVPTASTRDPLLVLQRHNSLRQDKAGERMLDESSEETGFFPAQQSDDPSDTSKRHDLVPCESGLLTLGSGTNKETILSISAPDSQSIAGLEKERDATMNRPGGENPERQLVMGITASPSQLDNTSILLVSGTRGVEADSCVTEGAGKPFPEAPPSEPARARLANPATRGRKAALKSDAAGQVPQSILPTEPVPAPIRMRPAAMPQPDPAANERPKRKMAFPGFVSARGGGPWSREAHDLLESGRPG
ncbi:hypothetical protein C8A03DRAFT_14118 [Achaetomium macrosporum]|uniref:5'-3' DNA helicase ZGRF1-like N-terminal domain-containing protein n=1 Tax=Achaetomium macrosporum TaxID=79813 RepID=A0AAN7CDD3_9PEZI|nr:hypothetical protein C8A03DRAFT_14118 [Achaetomium macrosporum]